MNAAEFNSRHEVGTPVFAYPGFRPEDVPDTRRLVTRTRTPAQWSASGHDVVWVDGEGSYISLTHVDVVSEAEWEAAKLADAEAAEGALPTPVGTDLRSVVHAALSTVQGTTYHLGLVTLEVLTDRVTDALTRANITATDAEQAYLRKDRDAWRDQRNAVFVTNQRLLAELEQEQVARLHAENETRTVRREAAALKARIPELEKASEPEHFGSCHVNVDGHRLVNGHCLYCAKTAAEATS